MGWESSKSISSRIWERGTKGSRNYKLVEDLIYGLNWILTTIAQSDYYQFQALSRWWQQRKKSVERKVASKEIMKNFSPEDSSARERKNFWYYL